MCKVLIKEVKTTYEPKSGVTNGKTWKRWDFDCLVEVDGHGPEAVRQVKTFEESIANERLEGKTYEAKKQGESVPFSFLLVKPRAGGHRSRNSAAQPFGPTNRQAALKVAVNFEMARAAQEGDAPDQTRVLKAAGELLQWLEGGEK